MLTFSKVSSGYNDVEILSDVSFNIKQGAVVGIIGPNGAGKSTLLRTATKAITPFGGEIFLQNRSLAEIPLKEIARSMAVVTQDTAFMFPFKVIDLVLLGRIPYMKGLGFESKGDLRIALEALESVDASRLKDRFIDELSSGERQRVIIAKALSQRPKILFLDEPTAHLDICHQVEMFRMLTKLNKESGLTIVSVLHDLNLASEYCDELILLSEGKIKIKGAPKEVLNYRIIEEVYKTLVIVKDNPLTGRPHVFLVKNK
ncbi:MAG: ABC transporter ATP-binding protein [Candidatus Omnitrophota bacterium]